MAPSQFVKSFYECSDGAAAVRAAADRRALRMPWEAVQRHMLERLHEHGFDDLDASHLIVFQYPGPQGMRRPSYAARLRITSALNYQLGELERLDYIERRPDPEDLRSKRVALTPRGELRFT